VPEQCLRVPGQEAYAGTDPANVSGRQVAGPPAFAADPGSAYLARVVVPTDAGDYEVLLSRTGAGAPWLVRTVPAAAGGTPPVRGLIGSIAAVTVLFGSCVTGVALQPPPAGAACRVPVVLDAGGTPVGEVARYGAEQLATPQPSSPPAGPWASQPGRSSSPS
jgi:hypothetical protein